MENPKKCIFIGGKQVGVDCLKALLKAGIAPQLVIPNLDDTGNNLWHDSLTHFAKSKKLKLITGKKVSSDKVVNLIKKIKPEIIFCIGGTQIIPKKVLRIPKLGCLNIHPAMLPKYRGRYSTVHA